MAGPFAERAFDFAPIRRDKTFEHDLGGGGERQAGDFAAHHLHRPAAQAADDVDLEHAVGRFEPAIEEDQRIAAEHHRHRHRLAALEIFLAMDVAVMSRRDQDADRIAVVHLCAVGAGIEPVLFRVAGDAVGAGADIAAAVLLVPDRRREFRHVDVVADQHVFQHRAVVDDLMRNDFLILEIGFAIGVAQFPFGQMIGKAERHVAARAGEHVEQHAKALRAAGDIVEHDTGAVLGAQHRFGGEPDILLPAWRRRLCGPRRAARHRRAIRANRHRRSRL